MLTTTIMRKVCRDTSRNGCRSTRPSSYQKGWIITLDHILTLWVLSIEEGKAHSKTISKNPLTMCHALSSCNKYKPSKVVITMEWGIYHCMNMYYEKYILMVVEGYGFENWSKTKDAHCNLLFLVFIYMRCHIT